MDALTVETVPAVIDSNYEAVKANLESEIQKYDIVVTADTVKQAKTLAADLNKVKAEIAARRKEVVAATTGPVKDFEGKVKELEAMCTAGRQKIVDQVNVFEQAKLEDVRTLVGVHLEDCYVGHKVVAEFRKADAADLVKLGAVTATGALTKATRDAIDARVMTCLQAQTRTELRLADLAVQSLKAGLHVPMEREHVEGILFQDDEAYQAGLTALIAKELDRQAETLAAAARKDAVESATDDSITAFEAPEEPPISLNDALDATAPPEIAEAMRDDPPQRAPSPPAPEDQQARFQVHVDLEVYAPAGVTGDRIVAALRKKLAAAGVEKSVTDISILQL